GALRYVPRPQNQGQFRRSGALQAWGMGSAMKGAGNTHSMSQRNRWRILQCLSPEKLAEYDQAYEMSICRLGAHLEFLECKRKIRQLFKEARKAHAAATERSERKNAPISS